MNEELGLVLITNKSLERSITGYIAKEIFSGGVKPLELVEARMYAPSPELIENYIKLIVEEPFKEYLHKEYINRNRGATKKRMMLLLFRGEDAISQIKGVVGHVSKRIDGTIRNLFAEFMENDNGEIIGFMDPSVIIIPDVENAKDVLSLWVEYSQKDGGLLGRVVDWGSLLSTWDEYEFEALKYREGISCSLQELKGNVETTIVLIKPDNIYTKSRRVGEIINALSGPGIKLIGAKAVNMSVNQALDFYAPIEGKLIEKLGIERGKQEFAALVDFMTGYDPYEVTDPVRREMRGDKAHQCLALVYQGPFVIERIRSKVGATDPLEAKPGTIRREYGHDIMRNGVHAADSPESAKREIEIIDIEGTTIQEVVKDAFASP